MISAFSIIVGLAVALIWILGILVLARSNKLQVNRTFALFVILLGFWVVANFIDNNYTNNNISLLAIRLDFFLGPLLAYSFWYFTKVFLDQITNSQQKKSLPLTLSTICLAASLLSFTNLFYSANLADGKLRASYSNYYAFYSIILGVVALLGIANLIIAYRRAKGIYKNQAAIILLGFFITVIFIVAANLLIPLITDSKTINLATGNIAYLGVAFFIGATAYTIIRHKLFDIRSVIARSMGYILSLGIIATISSLILFKLSDQLVARGVSRNLRQILNVITILTLALLYQPLKRYFDKLTNRFFYRDAYEPQVFMDNLNRSLVTTLELGNVLTKSSEIIGTTLKAEFCGFSIMDAKNTDTSRIIGLPQQGGNGIDFKGIREELAHLHAKTIITDELEVDNNKLKEILQKNDIAMMVRLTKSLKTPSQDIGHIVVGIKKSGNPYSSQDVKILEIVADELVIAIQNALRFEEIQNFNVTLQDKVDDATRQLRKANEKLKALDETKDEFISMASHQLRTPLTAVKGYISMVIEGDAGEVSDKQKPLLDQAFLSAQRMVYLIADLLNVSRLKTGKFVIDSHPTQLADVVEGELHQLTATAKSRGITLAYNKPANFPVLNLDETKLRQVIMNFADNAIYYTPSGGTVTVNLKDLGQSVEFTVTDSGIGVPKADQPHLFTKFYRANNAQKARPDGTGLGLFMAKKVIIAQGGSVVFASQEGKGSTFGFNFPEAKLQVIGQVESEKEKVESSAA